MSSIPLLSPIKKFVKFESFSGILLFVATIIAMIWANSSYSGSYQALWQYKISIGSDTFGLTKPLILWINDGLMAIFFFLIGLEIKRELLIGELNSIRKATFPIFAAIGGMIFPFAFFYLLNQNQDTSTGWGIPMATDIAFSLAILKLLGKSVPLNLKIFLTAFAIIDDLGVVIVIAIFYSGGVDWTLLSYAIALLFVLAGLSYGNLYMKYVTFILGLIIWTLFLKAGIHPTIAGVLLAFTIPIRQKVDVDGFISQLKSLVDQFPISNINDQQVLSKEQIDQVDKLEDLIEDFHSPLQHLEHNLHSLVAYFIMPLFALANAGIAFSVDMDLDIPLIINITLALFIGKFLGVSLLSFAAVKLRLADLPEGVNKMQILGVAILAGVGFTMSIFICNLAFIDNLIYVDSAKIGILIGSILSGVVGALILKYSGSKA